MSEMKYQSAGEAAYAQFASELGIAASWATENQDAWEQAAAEAILYGQQAAAEAQIAYFSKGAEVPYYIETIPDTQKLFTAKLVSPLGGDINISVDGKYLRTICCADLDDAVRFFTNIVKAPPGFVIG